MKTFFFYLFLAVFPLVALAQDQSTIVLNAGAPVNGTSEVQTLTIGGSTTGGSFKLSYDGYTTGAITWSATTNTLLANIQAALDALPNLEANEVVAADVSLSSGNGVISLTFAGNRANMAVNQIAVALNSLTGGTHTLVAATSTPGVDGTKRDTAKGTILVDTSTPGIYQNAGTSGLAPSWVQVASGTTPTFTTSISIGSAGVKLSDDGDGALTFLGLGNGTDEDLTINLDDTANTGTFTSSTGLNVLNFSSIALQESGVGVLNNDEIDASSELLAIMDDETGTGALTFATAPTFTTSIGVTGTITSTSASASALAVGLNGATNPSFVVDSSTGSQAAGLKITGAATGGTVAIAAIDSGADTNLTINGKGTGTIGIGSVSTGAVTITPATTVTGAITPTGGVAAAGGFTASARGCHTGGGVAQIAAAGTDKAIVVTEMYVSEIFVPANCTVTGVSVLMGSATEGSGATGTQAALFNSAGTRVAISDDVDASTMTTDAYGAFPFTSTYAAKGPATYYIGVISGVNTNKIRTHIAGAFGAVAVTGLVYSTEAGYATITPPTTFVTGVAPIASLY